MEQGQEHSPVGASGAERWMHCPGSVSLIKAMKLPETDEPDYRIAGTVAHAGLALCLEDGSSDAWEHIGEVMVTGPEDVGRRTFTDEMAPHVQTCLDYCRGLVGAASPAAEVFIEYRVHDDTFHPDFMGRVDFALVDGEDLYVVDYKHGNGIYVEVMNNPQLQYYAYGMLRNPACKDVKRITIVVVQPRITWGPNRGVPQGMGMTRETLEFWAAHELLQAMRATDEPNAPLDVGAHCRFCPAKLVCPAIRGGFAAMAEAANNNPDAQIKSLSDAEIALEYKVAEAVSLYVKALREETLRRALHGSTFSTCKLVRQRANRVWKDGARERFVSQYGDKVLTKPDFVSPPAAEKLDSAAKELVKEWAYAPDGGYTLAPIGDARAAVVVQTGADTFKAALTRMEDG